jgi:hypothetical protein
VRSLEGFRGRDGYFGDVSAGDHTRLSRDCLLNAGKLVEFDSPRALLGRPGSCITHDSERFLVKSYKKSVFTAALCLYVFGKVGSSWIKGGDTRRILRLRLRILPLELPGRKWQVHDNSQTAPANTLLQRSIRIQIKLYRLDTSISFNQSLTLSH